MDDENQISNSIAKIEGKTTSFGFNIKIFTNVSRNSYLATVHEGTTYIFGVRKLWNDQKGKHASLSVIGETPLTPFSLDSEIFFATPDQIKHSLNLESNPKKAINLGKILHTEIDATLNVENLGRLFITGKSGSGKSYTVGVLIEELMKKQIPIILIDRHGEYSSLKILQKEKIPADEVFFDKNDSERKFAAGIIEFGDPKMNPGVDLGIEYLLAAKLEDLVNTGSIIIINLRGLEIPIQENIVDAFCYRLYKASTLQKIPPHYLFIDEAHVFAGKKKNSTVETLKLSAQEGRKFGHNLIIITQKPQLLDVVIRAQAGTWIIHKLTDINDIKITCSSAEGFGVDADEEIQNLLPGEAIISGDMTPFYPLHVKIRERYTIHGGAGYNVLDFIKEGENVPKSEIVEKLRASFSPELLETASQDVVSNKKLNISELYLQIDLLRKENQDLKQKISDLNLEPIRNTLLPEIDNPKNIVDNITDLSSIPTNQLNDKLMALMEERDDAVIKVNEMENERDEAISQKQIFELEMSGLKVENETLKTKLEKEQKRADDAVALAERAVATMKKRRKK